MKINVVLDQGAKMPVKAHEIDAGFDLYSPAEFTVNPATNRGAGTAIINTGVHMQIPVGYVGFIKSKSGLNVKHGLTAEGVIDSGYTGSIVVKLYNYSDEEYKIHAGDKITQLVILPIPPVELEQVTELPETERGSNGFGSSGR